MVFSALATTTGDSPKKSSREGTRIDTFLIHHMAAIGGAGVTDMMRRSGGRTVSANYTIHTDGTLHGVVPEEFRAWTSGASGDGGRGAQWDRRSITVEIANSSGEPNWNISAAALQTAANLLADLRRRYSIENVLGHRDLYQRYGASYPTYCPGPNTVAQILALTPTSGGGGADDNQEDDMTPEQSKQLAAVHKILTTRIGPHNETPMQGIARLLSRQGGSIKQKTLTTTAGEARNAAQWSKARQGGSVKDPSITALLLSILELVSDGSGADTQKLVMDRAAEIDLTLDTDPDPEIEDAAEGDDPIESDEG